MYVNLNELKHLKLLTMDKSLLPIDDHLIKVIKMLKEKCKDDKIEITMDDVNKIVNEIEDVIIRIKQIRQIV